MQESQQQTKQDQKTNPPASGIGQFLYRILSGALVGLSLVAPGISGSVIAIMMGIYQDLLDILSRPTKNFKHNIIYLVPLVIGMALGMVAFFLVFRYLFAEFEKTTHLFFVGLILGTIPFIFREVQKHGFKIANGIVIALSCALTFAVSIFFAGGGGTGGSESAADLMAIAGYSGVDVSYLQMIYGGTVTGGSLLVPGMSTSVVLMLMGLYTTVIFDIPSALSAGDLSILPYVGTFVFFVFVGLILIARLIKKAFKAVPATAYSVVLGIISGSFLGIGFNALQINDSNFNWIVGIISFGAGTVLALFFVFLNARNETAKQQNSEGAARVR